jgi:hypothetical protein
MGSFTFIRRNEEKGSRGSQFVVSKAVYQSPRMANSRRLKVVEYKGDVPKVFGGV